MSSISFSFLFDDEGVSSSSSSGSGARSTTSDAKLLVTTDGCDLEFVQGEPTKDDGLTNAVIISLFGGNERDSGGQDGEPYQWWGNLSETDPSRTLRSELQNLIAGLPSTPSNLRRLEDAAQRDLSWMVGTLADSTVVLASMPAVKRVRIAVAILVNDRQYNYAFTQNWGNRS